MIDTLQLPLPSTTNTLLCLGLPDPILATLRAGGYRIEATDLSIVLPLRLYSAPSSLEIVLLDVTTGGQEIIDTVQRVRFAVCVLGATSRILCFSAAHRNPRFVLELEKRGARYVRISEPAMILEAINLLLLEISLLKRNGPSFCISHRFSRGSCAPGEEIAGIELLGHRDLFQLPLALSGRFVFNHLAESRSIALDAFQIVAGLNGWFYREHALNCGIRQTTKVRAATVKVLVQRIRQAIASAFAKAGFACDPYDVLRSFPAEGSKRVLYKLRAEIRWEHLPIH